jgi:hypothetical protein
MSATGKALLANVALRCFAGPRPTIRDRSYAMLVAFRFSDLYDGIPVSNRS